MHTKNWALEQCRRRNLRHINLAASFWLIVLVLATRDWSGFTPEDWFTAAFWGVFPAFWGLVMTREAMRALQYLRAPELHPTIDRLLRRGEDPDTLFMLLEQELRSPIVRSWGWKATPTFLVYSTYLSLEVHRWDELVWACGQTRFRWLWILPLGRWYGARLAFGLDQVILGGWLGKKKMQAILTHAAKKAPWALFGANQELLRLHGVDEVDHLPHNTWERLTHDIKMLVFLTPEEVTQGVTKTVPVRCVAPCDVCVERPLGSCNVCLGSGAAILAVNLQIQIPTELPDDDILVFAGRGVAQTPRGAAGDLLVDVVVPPQTSPWAAR